MKIGLVVAELFHAGGQTDMTVLVTAFRSLATRLKRLTYFGMDWDTVLQSKSYTSRCVQE